MSEYWKDRQATAQQKLTERSTAEVEKQLRRYYKRTLNRVIKDFDYTFTKLHNTVIRDNKEATPADLYKLDAYWWLQGQMRRELEKMGEYQNELYNRSFVNHWLSIYTSIDIGDNAQFANIDRNIAQQMINAIWCADGKSWSSRIWHNTDILQQTLNDGLIECVLAGRDEKYLRQHLIERFSVSYSNADMIVRTELAHIQTQAAEQRYKDAGITEVEVWADYDERRCDVCGELHQKRFLVGSQIPIPAHPRCRCCIVPVVE